MHKWHSLFAEVFVASGSAASHYVTVPRHVTMMNFGNIAVVNNEDSTIQVDLPNFGNYR